MAAAATTAAGRRAALDFSDLHESELLSDVTVILIELDDDPGPDDTRASKRRQQAALPGHGVVLRAASAYCKAKLSGGWRDYGAAAGGHASKLRIELPVPRGQLEPGRLLVKGMYCPSLDLSHISQQQQLQLLVLADRYEVPSVQSAAAAALEATPAAQWEWETAMAVFSLPPGCKDGKAFSGAITAAAAKLQQQLGDLELVHNDASGVKQQQLRELPFTVLKQLLQDPATRVHSENTVLYSIQQWHEHQPQGSKTAKAQLQQQAVELLSLVRMRHGSQLYVATVFGASALAASCLTPAELALAVAISGGSAGDGDWKAAQEADSPVLAKHSAWSADKRPTSALQQSFDWRLPLSELQRVLEQHLADPGRDTQVLWCPTTLTWQGHELRLKLECTSSSTQAQPSSISLGVYLCVNNMPDGGVSRVTFTVEVVPFGAARGKVHGPTSRGVKAGSGWGWPGIISLGSIMTWQEAAAALRVQGLVHAGSKGADKRLLLRLDVKEIQ